MVGKIFDKGRKFLTSPQTTVLSAATIIMLMVVASRVLGLVRQRTLALFFNPNELSLFFAAFRLPDLIFEVLVFGTFSSAFIPVFTKSLKNGEREAWEIAGRVVNLGLLFFTLAALIFGLLAPKIYGVIAPGYSDPETERIASLARILFAAQGFFVVSYVLTGVLESLRRFLVPALAPLFYNLGIILGTVFLAPKIGLYGPAIGVVIGALCHLLIQLPLAIKLGFRFTPSLRPTAGVKEIGRLSLPRLFDLIAEQIQKTVELSLASIISTASYTYFTLGATLQLLPVSLFGVSLAKAALPTLSRQTGNPHEFKKTLFTTLYQIVFLASPLAATLVILRIPLVRLIFGTHIFDWEATVQTGLVLSSFAIGIVFQSVTSVLERAFYALHDMKTPVTVSIISLTMIVLGDFILIKGFSFPVWGLATSFSVGIIFQTITLYLLLNRKLGGGKEFTNFAPLIKSILATLTSGGIMYFLLKVFDKSVWVKRLSFLGRLDKVTSVIPFEKFVLDTRYTVNLLILSSFVILVGVAVYLFVSLILRSNELFYFVNLLKRMFMRRKIEPVPAKEPEPVSPTPPEITS